MNVAALFVRKVNHYAPLGVDCYDIERDARSYAGAAPVVAHPPCRAWGRLSHFAKPRPDEKQLAHFAVAQVRRVGGVLEHPSASRLWREAALPLPGHRDEFGGFTLPISQRWFGHVAEKRTLLYIVGVEPGAIPDLPYSLDLPKVVNVKYCSPEVREGTPPLLAEWLVELALRCGARS